MTTSVQLTKRGLITVMIPFIALFSWYYVFSISIIPRAVGLSTETQAVVQSSFNFVMAIALLSSSFFLHRLNKIRVMYGFLIATSIATVILLSTSSTFLSFAVILVGGIFLAVAQLAFFAHFWDLTTPEERGRVSGLIGFFSLPFFSVVSLMIFTFSIFEAVVLGLVLSLGVLAVGLPRLERKVMVSARNRVEENPNTRRILLFYAVPWLLFSLINATLARNLSTHVLEQVPSSYHMVLAILQLGGAALGALVGGVFSDFFGRRPSLFFSLTFYGLSSALGGLVSNSGMFLFVYFANGMSWGILLTLYLFVIWGDLASERNCAKMYSIGLAIFYSAVSVGNILGPQISQIPLVVGSLVSCLLIFMLNVPLILAPELLSSDSRERIRMKLHMNAVRKIGRRFSKNQG